MHADDSVTTLLRQAGPAAREIILGANPQMFRSLSPYSGFGFKSMPQRVYAIDYAPSFFES